MEYKPAQFPVDLLTLSEQKGIRLRATVSAFGPVLMTKILGLNDTQGGVVAMIFKYCDDNKISSLDKLPSSLKHIQCKSNKLIYPFEPTIQNIRIFNTFKFMFYFLKCVKRLKKFMYRFRFNRCDRYKEQLMMKLFHPRNVHKFAGWDGTEHQDNIYE
jgi:hypothetical protein